MSSLKSLQLDPADIAREAFKQLSAARIQPTPDAYKKLYEEIAGVADHTDGNNSQAQFISELLSRTLGLALPRLLESNPELSKEAETLSLLFKKENEQHTLNEIGSRLKNLCFKIEGLASQSQPNNRKFDGVVPPKATEDPLVPLLAKLIAQTLTMAVGSLVQNDKTLFNTTDSLASSVKQAKTVDEFLRIETRLKDLCYKISLKSDDGSEQLQLLLSLFQLLLENVTSLLEDDNWLRGQVMVIQELIKGELDYHALIEATRGLKEVIYKQGILKDSINQNKSSVNNLMDLFVERLTLFSDTTSWYRDKINHYTTTINQSSNQSQVKEAIQLLLTDTMRVQTETARSHELMLSAKNEVAQAQANILELEKKLAEMSEQVHQDQLTGSLNRRGFDEIIEREAVRADRRHTPLCLCMLDIDNFKKLNDTYGHASGDGALIHLVDVVKKTLRTTDSVARYGGEEFAIIMPETRLNEGVEVMIRVQRELTKIFFLADTERLVITFSAGVVERAPSEESTNVVRRADKAMYQAKKDGKNRVATG